MLKILRDRILTSPIALTGMLAISLSVVPAAWGQETDATGVLDQINQYNNEQPTISESEEEPLSQVTSVSQLRDVQPTDWAFQALQSLVERYGCIEGYPDRTYRGNRAMTRYEFAAGLNACLDRIRELIDASRPGGGGGGVTREDLDRLTRLQEEFRTELATLRGRVDSLEARTARLEAQQFSTTAKLAGEAIFAATSIPVGQNAFGGDIDDGVAFGYRTRLNFESSFTGKDLLRVRLQSGNLSAYSATSTFTPEGDLSFAAGPFEEANGNNVELDELSYTFPIGRRTQVVVSANATGSDSFADTLNILDGDGGSGALSRFGTRHSIYYLADGAGIGLRHQFGDNVEVSLGYQGSSVNDPNNGSGLFNGPYGALAQVVFKSANERFRLGLTYAHAYNTDLGTGSRVANLRSYLAAAQPFAGDNNLPISSNSYGVEVSLQLARNFVLGGWAGYTNTRTLSTLDGQINRGEIDIFNGAITLGFPDLGKKGNLGGIIVGIEPIADASTGLSNSLGALETDLSGDDDDVSWHIEGFYQIQVTDNIAITPGVIWLTAPDHNDNNDDVIIGVVRTTFSF